MDPSSRALPPKPFQSFFFSERVTEKKKGTSCRLVVADHSMNIFNSRTLTKENMDKINVRRAKQAHHRVLLFGNVWFGNGRFGWSRFSFLKMG
jgi:fructosamine-3-kinase